MTTEALATTKMIDKIVETMTELFQEKDGTAPSSLYEKMVVEFFLKRGEEAVRALYGFIRYAELQLYGQKQTEALRQVLAHDINGRNDEWALPRSTNYKDMNYKTYDYRGYTIKIDYDEDPLNPLKEFDYLGTFSCYHRRYDLSSPKNPYKDDLEGLQAYLKTGKALFLPLYLIDHSGISIRTSSFNDPWDSGQVGYIWVDKDAIRKEWKVKRISKKLKALVFKNLNAEVETFDNYLTGKVFGYTVEDKDGEYLDSCSGFYGDPDYVENQAHDAVDYHIKQIGEQLEIF